MQTTNSTTKYDDQSLDIAVNMHNAGMTCPQIAEAWNDAGIVKIRARNAFTAGDISNLIHKSYPQAQKRICPAPDQVVDMGVLLTKFKLYLGVEDDG